LFEFYTQAFSYDGVVGGEVPVLDNSKVRASLSVLFYDQTEFQIHEKADAFEALDKILTIIHSWTASLTLPDGNQGTLNSCLDKECLD
jgi:hypothetical protein